MRLENEFTVPAPPERAWEVLMDVERVAPCLPGAVIDASRGNEHDGTMTIKLGPIVTRYQGTVRIEDADEDARRAVMRAQARDARGHGTAAATITSTMEPTDGGTRVHVQTDMRVTGAAAQFGRGVMQEVSAKLMSQFADSLAEEILRDPAAAAEAPEQPGEEAAAPPVPVPPSRPSAEVLDVAAIGREAVLKRALPALGALCVAVLLFRSRRRR